MAISLVTYATFIINAFITFSILFFAYRLLKKTIKKWTYDASYDALAKFEKDQREQLALKRVNEIRRRYG